MPKNALDIIHDQTKKLRNVSNELAQLRDAFEMTGNLTLADDLERMAVSIHSAQETITKAYHDEIHEQMNAKFAQVGKTLEALVK